jgi:hypothetical protein
VPTVHDRLAGYRENVLYDVHGWLGPKIVDILELSCVYHQDRGVRGHAFEIGVYQGHFFLALLAAIEADEVAVAADIFDDQELNIDGSGSGKDTYRIFTENVARYASNQEALRLLAGDSLLLRAEDVLALSGGGKFRFISVDGGHTAEHVMNDLGLASDLIVSGGVVFLDDFFGPHWPGVTEGFIRFMLHANRNLAPVIFADNKLMLTTISEQPRMVKYMREHFRPKEGASMAEVSLGGFDYIASSHG